MFSDLSHWTWGLRYGQYNFYSQYYLLWANVWDICVCGFIHINVVCCRTYFENFLTFNFYPAKSLFMTNDKEKHNDDEEPSTYFENCNAWNNRVYLLSFFYCCLPLKFIIRTITYLFENKRPPVRVNERKCVATHNIFFMSTFLNLWHVWRITVNICIYMLVYVRIYVVDLNIKYVNNYTI